MKVLLSLKADYKAVTNTDWKPGCTPPAPAAPAATAATAAPAGGAVDANVINQNITDQGSKVRQLKADKAPKVRKRK